MCPPSKPISSVASKREWKSILIAYIGLQRFWICHSKEWDRPYKYLHIAVVDLFVSDGISRPTTCLNCIVLFEPI
jgi:hypothetical protein